MPLFKIAESKNLEVPVHGLYTFAEEQYCNWHKFWMDMGGDIDKILKFATDLGIEEPKEWYEELHRFLFSVFCGSYKIVTASKSSKFNSFLKEVIENHKKEPKDQYWYSCKGLSKDDFFRIFEVASEFEDPKESIRYINSRVPDFGSKVYNEWVLTQAMKKEELRSIANNKMKNANKIESEVFKTKEWNVGEKIQYFGFDDDLEIIEVNTCSAKKIAVKDIEAGNFGKYIICKDSKNVIHKITDFEMIV